jgi:hypothetical protein
MKPFKILLGVLFAVCAVSSLLGGLQDKSARMDSSTSGLTNIFALVAAVGMFSLFSIWSFQSAFRKPASTHGKTTDTTESNAIQPQNPTSLVRK